MVSRKLLLLLSSLISWGECRAITGASNASRDWSEAVTKAEDFLAQLTLEEKAYIATGVAGPCTGSIAPIERLGFRGLCIQDGPLAIRPADFASVYPAGVSVGASWDKELAHQRGVLLGEEFKAKGANVMLGPVVGPLGRDPLGGRNWEGFGPDPYLSGELGYQSIVGTQSTGMQSCVKHYIGYEQATGANPTPNTDGVTIQGYSSNIDDRTMHEIYSWPFASAVRAGVSSVMCAYSRVNGSYSCENNQTLNAILKEELGFRGYVMSDWGGTMSGAHAIENGLDIDMPGGAVGFGGTSWDNSLFGGNLIQAVNNGTLSTSRVNDIVLRVMTPYFYLNQDRADWPLIDPSSKELGDFSASMANYSWPVGGEAHRDVRGDHGTFIRKLAAESVTLLKNQNGALPITEIPRCIAVFGNDAADKSAGLASSPDSELIGTFATGGGSGSGRLTYLVSPLEAIKTWAKGRSDSLVQYITDNELIPGLLKPNSVGFGAAIYPIPEVCFVFLRYYVSEGPDHSDFDLNNNGSAVVNAVASVCNNTIVVTHSGNANLLDWADHPNVTAIMMAYMPGQESGNAILDVITGQVNPSGKLPFTVAYNASDYNTAIVNFTAMDITDPNGRQVNFTEGQFFDYRHFDHAGITPRYEFGYGLSYTNFSIGGLSLKAASGKGNVSPHPDPSKPIQPGGNPELYEVLVTVKVKLTNTGSLAGATVPQLYLAFPQDTTPAGTPVKVLRGFEKIHLKAGGSQTVAFELTRKDVSFWNVVTQDWEIPAGTFEAKVGLSSRRISVTKPFELL
ncbi:beta-glucosidase [Aspergillus brunneoviolaceus CBS 621.78]|uniref:Beta-glucosidase G n=1 Tax=Aspergillus brunneoviolaceus CBS 621.78 TaxID=1450534 RepID=A0ACD1FXY1_9EURO|nr:beta-glucosidase G [Aspergillus brunneoviolaceus CBS 621.78]RAH41830.1 beta-glucosidase G [Aspergillus brunneoviolaceus CBS 621.78]